MAKYPDSPHSYPSTLGKYPGTLHKYPGTAAVYPPGDDSGGLVELTTVALDAFGDTAVNTAMLRCCNPVTDIATGIQYLGFHTQPVPKLALAKRTYSGGVWGALTVDTSAVGTTASDQHNFFSLATDAASRLHLAGDMHGAAMRYDRLVSGDINFSAYETPPIVSGSTLESSVTYPTFIRLADGDLLMFFRDGGAGDGTLVMYRWDSTGATWSTVHTTLVDGEGAESFYPWQIRYNLATGKLHIGGCWRVSADLNTNHDVIYFYLLESEDFANAYKVSGAAQTLPVTRANADKAKTIAVQTGLLNTGGTGWKADDTPILSYFRDPGDGFSQLYVAHRVAGAWVENAVPGDQRANCLPFTLAETTGDWPLSVFSSPSLLVDGNRTIIVGTYTTLGTGVWAWVCEDSSLEEWQPYSIHTTDVQEWACVADLPQWDTNGELYCLHQKAARPTAADIGAQTLSILRWRPQAAAFTYEAPTTLWDPTTVSGCIGYLAARVGGATVYGAAGDSDQYKCNDLLDARTSTTLFVQATNSDAPSFDHDFFDHAGLGTGEHRPGVRFTASTVDFMLCTDATILTALTGVNVPFYLVMVVQLATAAANQRFGSIGTSTDITRYIDWGTDASGNVSFGRRVAGGAETRFVGTSALAISTDYIIEYVFDGSVGSVTVNGVAQTVSGGASTLAMAFAGTLTPTHLSAGCRRRAANELFSDYTLGAQFMGTTIPNSTVRSTIRAALAAEYGITL